MSPGFTVLVVDDEPLVGRLVKTLLERVGLRAVTVRSAAEALDHIHRGEEVGLVITDLQMPNIGGIELCELLHQDFPAIPVIAMTGSSSTSENEDLRKACAAGAKSAILKPFNLADFYDAVNQATWTRAYR
ncbi:MAG TPA: response regulator [Opitutaceae bacterium]|jgi:CheY-like chemotaxis protein